MSQQQDNPPEKKAPPPDDAAKEEKFPGPVEGTPPASPRAVVRWDDEGGALPEGPAEDLPAGKTEE